MKNTSQGMLESIASGLQRKMVWYTESKSDLGKEILLYHQDHGKCKRHGSEDWFAKSLHHGVRFTAVAQ